MTSHALAPNSNATRTLLPVAVLASLVASCSRPANGGSVAQDGAGTRPAPVAATDAHAGTLATADAHAGDAAAAAAETSGEEGEHDEANPPPEPPQTVRVAFERLAPEEIRRGGVCAAFRRVHVAAIRARVTATEARAVRMIPQGVGACMPAGHGAWAIALESVRIWTDAPAGAPAAGAASAPFTFAGRYRVVYITPDGAVHGAMPALLACHGTDPVGRANACAAPGRRTTRVELRQLADYDGDGEREVMVHVTEAVTDGNTAPERARIYSLHHGSVDTFGPTHRLAVRDARDVDNDRRPDLRVAVYTAPGPLNAEDHPAGLVEGPRFLAHATPEGRFSMSDAVAQRELLRVCRAAPAHLVVVDRAHQVDLAATGRNVVCARARGGSIDSVTDALRAGCASFADNVHRARGAASSDPAGVCPRWLITWARRAPPVTLHVHASAH